MNLERKHWSKTELKIYILLLCANIDSEIKEEEISFIKNNTDLATFNRIYKEFCKDDEDTCFEKIEYAIGKHEFSHKELNILKKEVCEIFNSDDKFHLNERYLEKVLDNILY